MAILGEERPVLSRLDRLDNMLRQLEEMRGCNVNRSPSRSSCASTPSSESRTTFTSDQGHDLSSAVDFSGHYPTSLEKHCRSIHHVMVETQVKGTLIERLDQVEDRLLKLEEELEAEKKMREDHENHTVDDVDKKPAHKKGIKQFVKQCVKGKHSKHRSSKDMGLKNSM